MYWFFDNFCRLDEKLPAKKTATSNVRKNEEYVVENLKFEIKTDKKVEESKTKSEYKPLELKKQPLEDATNALKDKVKTFFKNKIFKNPWPREKIHFRYNPD